jgi:hypothetical protein
MNRSPIKSNTIKSVGFDENEHVLELEFINGSIYKYFDIPKKTYLALLCAPSVGQYFNQNISGNKFKYSKVK